MAQLVAQLTLNQKVVGSIPTVPTKHNKNMTFNVNVDAHGKLREDIIEYLTSWNIPHRLSENDWFDGMYGGRQIRGIGFEDDNDRMQFILAYKDKMRWCVATDDDFKWGYDPFDIDF